MEVKFIRGINSRAKVLFVNLFLVVAVSTNAQDICENIKDKSSEDVGVWDEVKGRLSGNICVGGGVKGKSSENVGVGEGVKGNPKENIYVSAGVNGKSSENTGTSAGVKGKSSENVSISGQVKGKSKGNICVGADVKGKSKGNHCINEGVKGKSNKNTGISAGVNGKSSANTGIDESVKGKSKENTGISEQVNGKSSANAGISAGVKGTSKENTGISAGVKGKSSENTGIDEGVKGKSKENTGISKGVKGTSKENTGIDEGVKGKLSANTGISAGVKGKSSANTGISKGVKGKSKENIYVSEGVKGNPKENTGVGAGVKGKSSENVGVGEGVKGKLNANTGISAGVNGKSSANTGISEGVNGNPKENISISEQVKGKSSANTGIDESVKGKSSENTGISEGIKGKSKENAGVGEGVKGKSSENVGVGEGVKGNPKENIYVSEGVNGNPIENVCVGDEVKGKPKENAGISTGVKGKSNANTGVGADVKGKSSGNTGISEQVNGKSSANVSISGQVKGKSSENVGVGAGVKGTSKENTSIDESVKGNPKENSGISEQVNGKSRANHGISEQVNGKSSEDTGIDENIKGNPKENHGIDENIKDNPKENPGISENINGKSSGNPGISEKVKGKSSANTGIDENIKGESSENVSISEKVKGNPKENTGIDENINGKSSENVSISAGVKGKSSENTGIDESVNGNPKENHGISKEVNDKSSANVSISGQVKGKSMENIGTYNAGILDSIFELGEAVVEAKSPVRHVRESSFNVSALDAKVLHNYALDLAQVLDRVSGVKVRENGGVGSNTQISLNGFSGRHVKIFMDGVPMEGFGSSFQINNIPVQLADRIEVYKGVVPVELGADALGGAVNIVTAQKRRTFADVSYSYGSFNTHKSNINLGAVSKNGLFVNLNAYQNYSDNSYRVKTRLLDLANNRYSEDEYWFRRFHDNYHNEALAVRAGVNGKSFADRLQVELTLSREKQDIQNANLMKIVYGGRHRRGQSLIPSVTYEKRNVLLNNLNVRVRANYSITRNTNVDTLARQYNWNGEYRAKSFKGEGQYTMGEYDNSNGALAVNLNYRLNGRHQVAVNNMLGGYSRKATDALANAETGTAAAFMRRTNVKNVYGASYRFEPSGCWNAAVFFKRYDVAVRGPVNVSTSSVENYEEQRRAFGVNGYGVAVSFRPAVHIQLKASYERAYRLPAENELFGDENLETGDVSLKPENSHNLNVNLIYERSFGKIHSVYFDAGLIFRDAGDYIRRQIEQRYGGAFYTNHGKVRNYGADVDARYFYGKIFSAGGNITYQDVRNMERYSVNGRELIYYRDRMPNIPYLFGNIDANFNLHGFSGKGNTLAFGYRLRYVHSFFRDWQSEGGDIVIPQQASHDLSILYSLRGGRYSIGVEARNITGEILFDNYSLQKPGRNFLIGIRYSFYK